MTIDELFEFIATKARKIYNKDHRHVPMFFLDLARPMMHEGHMREFVVIALDWKTVSDRDAISIQMKALCGLGFVRNIAFVHEVYMLEGPEVVEASKDGVPPSEHPQSKSVLWLHLESSDYERRIGYWRIVDPDTKRARLGDWSDMPKEAAAEGRFANFFGAAPIRQ